MRWSTQLVLIVVLTGASPNSVGLVAAERPQFLTWCSGDDNPTSSLQIESCTLIIQSDAYSGKQHAAAFCFRAIAFKQMGQYDRAIADFDEAMRIDPKNSFLFLSRGYAYVLKRDLDRAIHDFDQAIVLDPDNALAYTARGSFYEIEMGDSARAIAEYDQAIRHDPKNALAFRYRGSAKQRLGDMAGGAADIERARDLQLEITR